MSPVMEAAAESKATDVPVKKPPSASMLRLGLQKSVNSSLRRCKATDGSFSYLCLKCEAKHVGRRSAAEHLQEEHGEMFANFTEHKPAKKDLVSELVKVVMNVPFADKLVAPEPEPETAPAGDTTTTIEKQTEKAGDGALKIMPLTLDMMKLVNERFSLHVGGGGVAGRLARQLGLLFISKSSEEGKDPSADENPTYFCTHCKVTVASAAELKTHLEAQHQTFLQNLFKLFPQVEKRFAVHLEKVFSEFIIEPRTDAPTAAAKTAGVKRKGGAAQSESAAPEPKKKAVEVKSKAAAAAMPTTLRLPNPLFKHEDRYKEQHYREKELLEKLSPSQLRKLVMEYIGCITSLASLDFEALASKMKIEQPALFLVDFCSLLYEKAIGYYEKPKNTSHSLVQHKAFKIGHILVNSNQCKLIISHGVKSVRVGLLSHPAQPNHVLENWRHPIDWKPTPVAGEELGPKWGRMEDSRLLMATYVNDRDLEKVAKDPRFGFTAFALGADGVIKDAFRERYGYILNLYMFGGKFNENIGSAVANLQPATKPPADFVVPQPAVEVKKAAPKPVAVVRPPAKVTANKRSTTGEGGGMENFDQVEKEVDTIDLYDDDDDDVVVEVKEKNGGGGEAPEAKAAEKEEESPPAPQAEEPEEKGAEVNGGAPADAAVPEVADTEEDEPTGEAEADEEEVVAVAETEAAAIAGDVAESEAMETGEEAEVEAEEEEEEVTADKEAETIEEPEVAAEEEEKMESAVDSAVASSPQANENTADAADEDEVKDIEEAGEATSTIGADTGSDQAGSSAAEEEDSADLMDVAVTPSGRGGRGRSRGRRGSRRGAI